VLPWNSRERPCAPYPPSPPTTHTHYVPPLPPSLLPLNLHQAVQVRRVLVLQVLREGGEEHWPYLESYRGVGREGGREGRREGGREVI